MALNSSGPISLGGSTTGQSINLELGQIATAVISLNDSNVRSLAGKTTAGSPVIIPTDFWGKSAVTYWIATIFDSYATTTYSSPGGGIDYSATQNSVYACWGAWNGASGKGRVIKLNADTGALQYLYQHSGNNTRTFPNAVFADDAHNQVVYLCRQNINSSGIVAYYYPTAFKMSQNLVPSAYLRYNYILNANNLYYGSWFNQATGNFHSIIGYSSNTAAEFLINNTITDYSTPYTITPANNINVIQGANDSSGKTYYSLAANAGSTTAGYGGFVFSNSSGLAGSWTVNKAAAAPTYGNGVGVNSSGTKILVIMRSSTTLKSYKMLDASGNVLWEVSTTVPIGCHTVKFDSDDNVYIYTGISATSASIIKYNSSGVMQWQRTITGNGFGGNVTAYGMVGMQIKNGFMLINLPMSYTGVGCVVMKLPLNGSVTGTYTTGGASITIAASSYTDSSFSLATPNAFTQQLKSKIAPYSWTTWSSADTISVSVQNA